MANLQVFVEEQVEDFDANEVFNSSSYGSVIQEPNGENQDNINTSVPKYKGVVFQPNGRWGAQIYANSKKIWLGTFKYKEEAAEAYDSASMKIRSWDFKRNFPLDENTIHEQSFQRQFNEETVINMIKDGSYYFEFLAFVEEQTAGEPNMSSPPKCEEVLKKESEFFPAPNEEDHVPDALEEEKDMPHREPIGSTSQGVMLFGVRIA